MQKHRKIGIARESHPGRSPRGLCIEIDYELNKDIDVKIGNLRLVPTNQNISIFPPR